MKCFVQRYDKFPIAESYYNKNEKERKRRDGAAHNLCVKRVKCMRKGIASVLAVVMVMLLAFGMTGGVYAQDDIKITIDGTQQSFDQMPVMVNDRVLVPMRGIFEALGAEVSWDDATQTASGVKDGKTVSLAIGSTNATVNGAAVTLDVPAQLVNDRTMVPVRFISESLGAQVDWDDASQTVIVKSAQTAPAASIKRPVPTQFSKSSDLSDLIFYEEGPQKDPVELFESLPQGELLVSQEDFMNAGISGAEYGSKERISVTGMPFSEAHRVTITKVPVNSYSIQLKMIPKTPLEEGDVVLAVMYMRTVSGGIPETGTGQIQMNVEEKTSGSNKKVVQGNMTAGPEWEVGFFPFVASSDFLENIHMNIRLGFFEQVVDIGGVELINYGKQVTLDDLPKTAVYNGMAPDAPWRQEAMARIEQIRKGDVNIVVQDASGNPVSGAAVTVNETESAFEWGSAVNTNVLGSSQNAQNYQDAVRTYFNSAVCVNEHKWKYYEEQPEKARGIVDWLKNNGISHIRGHVLIWESTSSDWAIPDDIFPMLANKDRAAFDQRVKDHITSVVGDFNGEINDWDVVNEMVRNTTFRSVFGNELLVDWFNWVREANPDAERFISETGIVGTDRTLDTFVPLLDELEAKNVAYEGICIHGHFGAICDPMKFYEQIDTLATRYGKRIKISEFDFNEDDELLQGNFVRDILIACFSHEAVDGFYMWGFWDGSHWLDNAPLLREDWTLKPSGEQFVDLVYNKWWTRESGQTGADGRYGLRAYYGDYEITAAANGQEKTVTAKVEKGKDNTIVITLD